MIFDYLIISINIGEFIFNGITNRRFKLFNIWCCHLGLKKCTNKRMIFRTCPQNGCLVVLAILRNIYKFLIQVNCSKNIIRFSKNNSKTTLVIKGILLNC